MNKRAIEQTGLIPRSIIRTFERFLKQLLPRAEMLVIQEFRISRYQVIVSVRCFLTLLLVPIIVNFFSKTFLITPLVEFIWNNDSNNIFLNSYQQKRALEEICSFEDKIYFESLLNLESNQQFILTAPLLKFPSSTLNSEHYEILEIKSKELDKNYQQKILEIATNFNNSSIQAISNLFADFFSFFSFSLVFIFMKPQIIILKSFLAESLYSLSDTTKSFLLILGTDLLVGFHSPHGWEVFLEGFLRHLGLPENVEFMSLFVATFPVFLDTVFKYWIFRSLNKISPSTVATYHNMIE